MTKAFPILQITAGALLVGAFLACAQQNQRTSAPSQFVRAFYDRYLELVQAPAKTPPWGRAISLDSSSFQPSLAALIQADVAAQAKCKSLIGLDFDPFLNTQEPASRYEVGAVSQAGVYFDVQVFAVREGARERQPAVIAQVIRANGRLQFSNFLYPDSGTTLLGTLRSPAPQCP